MIKGIAKTEVGFSSPHWENLMNRKDSIIDWALKSLFFVIPTILHWRAIYKGELMFSGDGMISFSHKIFQYQSIAAGEIPLWNSYVTAGSPFLADPISAFFYPFHALALVFSPTLYTSLYYILHMGLAGLFTYLFLKQIGRNKIVAFAGGIVFSLSPVIGGFRREHVAVYTSIIWVPLILFFIERFVQSERKRDLIFSALAMTMQLVGGHPQWIFYTDILAFCYLIFRLLFLKRSLISTLGSVMLWGSIYLLFSSAYLVPIGESIVQSSRSSTDYFCLYSTSWKVFLMTIFPNIFGDIYFPLGDYASAEISIEVYLGTITLIYALYAILYHFGDWWIKFSSIAMALSLLYSSSCNTPFLAHIIERIPFLNAFGVQSRILFVFIFFGVVCFAHGISDINNANHLKRLAKYSLFTMLFIIFIAVLTHSLGWSVNSETSDSSVKNLTSSPFGVSIALSATNCLLIGGLYITREHVAHKYGSIFTIIILLFLTGLDLWRYSSLHSTADFNALTKTEEIAVLKKLLNANNSYRIMTIYKNIYGGDYYRSGLVDNWSEINGIRNLKGFSEFENTRLNQLLGQTESRDNQNGYRLLSEGGILSMLSVKYILIPVDSPAPKAIPTVPESEILYVEDSITIPGNGVLFVSSNPVHLMDEGYYQIKFNVEAQGTDVQLFYVDFYGGPEYDQPQQDKHFKIKKGSNNYDVIIYAGEEVLHQEDVTFRVVGITNTPLVINNLKVIKLVDPPDSPDYTLVSQTSKYRIYENRRAQKLLYIPKKIRSIGNDNNLRRNPSKYPYMDQISYIEGYKNFSPTGDLEILSVKNNSLIAHVSSQSQTFVVHSQSFFPGWKAYVDEEPTQIYLVNGVVQGIEVPSGEHRVKFEFDPRSVKLGAVISLISLLTAAIYIIIENKNGRSYHL